MKFAAAPALIVPAGTAAAAVIARAVPADEPMARRRWATIAALPSSERREAVDRLVGSGVLTRLVGRVLVLRILREGARSYAAVVLVDGADEQPAASPSASGAPEPVSRSIAFVAPCAAYTAALEAAARVRPLFHGVADDGCTYSGFDADEPEAILGALDEAAHAGSLPPRSAVQRGVHALFSGPAQPIPAGLALVP